MINSEKFSKADTSMTAASTEPRWRTLLAAAVGRGQAELDLPKQQRSRARRAEIVKAATQVFARDGVARARLVDVAAEAGVPLSSVYDYFVDKEDIAYGLPVPHVPAFLREFDAKARVMRTARERVRLFLWLTVDFARRNQEWARTLYLEIWPSVMVEKAVVREILDDYARVLQELIVDGARLGEWEMGDPYETMTIFIGSINQLVATWLLYRNPRDVMKAASSAVERLLTLLAPAQPVAAARPRTGRGARARAAVKG